MPQGQEIDANDDAKPRLDAQDQGSLHQAVHSKAHVEAHVVGHEDVSAASIDDAPEQLATPLRRRSLHLGRREHSDLQCAFDDQTIAVLVHDSGCS
jgi:hypothetical protein